MMEGWQSTLTFFGIMVTAGVVTAVAIELVTKRLQEMAILSARAELQKLMLATVAQPSQQSSSVPALAPAPPNYPPGNVFI